MKGIATVLWLLAQIAPQGAPSEMDVKHAQMKLEKAPDDGPANGTIGRALAADGEWDKAVESLKKSKNSVLDKLFEREAAVKADNAFDLVEVGDEWVKAMAKAGPLKTLCRDRGFYWYALAWPKLDAVWKEKLRDKVQKLQGYSAASVPIRKSAGKADRWNGFNDSTYSYLDSTFAYDGKFSAKLLTTGKEKESWFAFVATEQFQPPPAGTDLTISAWVYTTGTDKDGSVNARFFDSNGKLLDQHGPAIDPDFPFWRKYTFKAKVPEGARRMDVPFLHRSVPGVTWVDRVSVSDGKKEFVQNGSLEEVK